MAEEEANPELEGIEGEGITPQDDAQEESKETPEIPDKEIDNQDEDVEPEEIPVRNTAAHIIARKNRQIEKLKAKQRAEEEGDYEDREVEERGGKDPRVDALIEALAGKEDEAELKTLFTDEPEAKKYEKRIRAYMKHPSYKDVPPAMIYAYLSRPSAKSAAERQKEIADKEAAQVRGGGTTRRPTGSSSGMPSAEEIASMSEDEFEALQHKVLTGQL